MEYVYAALVLHEAGTEITEDNVRAILEAGEIDVDDARVKSLVSALEDVDVGEAMAESAAAPVAAGGGAGDEVEETEDSVEEEPQEEQQEAEPEEDEDDEDEDDADAGEGLGELFG
jgi:large subunit ribosomal protein L12